MCTRILFGKFCKSGCRTHKRFRRSKIPNLGVDFGPTNFPKVAEALGGEGRWVSDKSDLIEAFEDAYERRTFSLLACKVGYKVYDGRF